MTKASAFTGLTTAAAAIAIALVPGAGPAAASPPQGEGWHYWDDYIAFRTCTDHRNTWRAAGWEAECREADGRGMSTRDLYIRKSDGAGGWLPKP
ncbi:MAG: hypothetical protein HOQ24_13800, partial [Mycobacteriaceae bacterium]|nr:hypothetical protein [Mycobacteriaceae bacterium]